MIFGIYTPEITRSCPTESKLWLRKPFTESELMLHPLEALWGSGGVTRQGRSDSTLDFRIYKLNPNFYCFPYKYAFVLLLASKTSLFKVGNSLKENPHFFYFFFSWIQVIICKTVTGHTAISITLLKMRLDLNTACLNPVSTQAYTSVLSEMNSCQRNTYYLFLTLTWAIMNTVTKEV